MPARCPLKCKCHMAPIKTALILTKLSRTVFVTFSLTRFKLRSCSAKIGETKKYIEEGEARPHLRYEDCVSV